MKFTDDPFFVKGIVEKMCDQIPSWWQRYFPPWYVVVLDHETTFPKVKELIPVLRENGLDARHYCQLARSRDDWWSVNVITIPPADENFFWTIWVRHEHDRRRLGQMFLAEVGSILWKNNGHIRACWAFSMRKIYGEKIRPPEVEKLFCNTFTKIMFDREGFIEQHGVFAQPMLGLDEMIKNTEFPFSQIAV